jgi:hypothetical protein
LGSHKHQWISPKKKQTKSNSTRKQLAEMFPNYKDDELDLLSAITTQTELEQYLRDHGNETK